MSVYNSKKNTGLEMAFSFGIPHNVAFDQFFDFFRNISLNLGFLPMEYASTKTDKHMCLYWQENK